MSPSPPEWPPMSPAALLFLSDYVDALLAESQRRERAAFERGRVVGHDQGRREVEAEEADAWRALLGDYRATMRIPAFAELERRRYGPAGRQSWMVRLDGEPGMGRTPAEHRRRARRRGEPDPFHRPHGPTMTCTACTWWGLPCPDDKETDDA
jgi:hypothetical protein